LFDLQIYQQAEPLPQQADQQPLDALLDALLAALFDAKLAALFDAELAALFDAELAALFDALLDEFVRLSRWCPWLRGRSRVRGALAVLRE
jgi:hypothetical protein